MSTTEAGHPARNEASVGSVDMKLEAVVIPVSDVDRAKAFYEGLGWRLDADLGNENFRIVQLNPPGSDCSVQFGTGLTAASPGSAESLLVVSDIEQARDDLAARAPTRARSSTTAAGATTAGTPTSSERSSIRTGAPTRPSWSSATRTATSGSCRRSRAGCRVASTRPRSAPPTSSGEHSNEQRPRTASTRSAPASETRTGPSGTPRTCWRSKPAPSFRPDRLRRHRPRRRCTGRALRRRARGGRPARRRRRTRARRRRVLLLGVHPVEDAASPG